MPAARSGQIAGEVMASRITAFIVVAIVAGTLIAGLIVGAQRDDTVRSADLLIINGKVYSADGTGSFTEAVAIKGNEIAAVGSNRELKRLRRLGTTVLDARGGTVLPGFNDSHLRLLWGGLSLEHVNLAGALTVEEVRDRIAGFASAHPDRPWVTGHGWYYAAFPSGLPHRDTLDEIVGDRPAYFTCYDGHTGWASSKALELAGIGKGTPNPRGGHILRDPRTGEPTGVLRETAKRLVESVLPETTREDRLRAVQSAVAEAHRHGITSVHDLGATVEDMEILAESLREGELLLRIYATLPATSGFTEEEAREFEELRRRYGDHPTLKVGAVKIALDQVAESHLAALLSPYEERAARRISRVQFDELSRIVTMMDAREWQILVEAADEGGVRMALDAYERAATVNLPPERGRRHRIEHVETFSEADLPRFASLGVIAAPQPFLGNPSESRLAMWRSNNAEAGIRGWAFHTLSDTGARLAFGSGWPVASLDPRLGLNMAVNRTTPRGTPPGGWLPEQKLPLAAALDAYTVAGAYASFEEHRKGTIKRGMLADLVILSGDIFAWPPERLLDAFVDVTIFDGKVVFSRQKAWD
jgi:predicted amidohydrolase YtcJ